MRTAITIAIALNFAAGLVIICGLTASTIVELRNGPMRNKRDRTHGLMLLVGFSTIVALLTFSATLLAILR